MTRPPLRGRIEFRRVLDSGGRARRNGVVVGAARRDGERGRLGLMVPSSTGGAVVRNRIRRRLRAAIGHCDVPGDVDVTIRADGSVADMDFQELVTMLRDAARGALARMPT